jgi:hypothetical protein
VGVVGADGELGEHEVVRRPVESVIEPRLSFLEGARKGKARNKLVIAPPVFVLDGRDKVCGGEAEVIVADAGVEA